MNTPKGTETIFFEKFTLGWVQQHRQKWIFAHLPVHVKNAYFFDFSVENVEKHCLVQFFELFSLQWLFKHAYEVYCDIQKVCMGRFW